MMLSSFDVLSVFWRATWQAAILAAVVFVLCRVFERSISASAKTLLWTLPILRLLVLVVPASSLSIFNAASLLSRFEPVAVQNEPTAFDSNSNTQTQMQRAAKPIGESAFSSTIAHVSSESAQSLTIATPAAIDASAKSLSLTDGIVAIWMIGVAVFFTRYLVGHIALRKAISSGRAIRLDELLPSDVTTELTSKVAHRARFIVVEENLGPAVTGAIRPVILLPRQMVERYSQDELRMVVMHELEHVRRYDTMLMFLAQLATIVHWCNPLVFWLKRRVQAQAEIAVDAATLRKLGTDQVKHYAELLFKVASVNRTPAYMLSMARKSATFRQRIEQLAEIEHHTPLRTLVGLLAIAGVVLTGLSDAISQERTPAAPIAAVVTEATEPIREPAQESTEKTTDNPLIAPANPASETAVPQEAQEAIATPNTKEAAPKAAEPQATEPQATESKAVEASKEADVRTVSGRVVDAQGKGVPNASLFRSSGSSLTKGDLRATTDQNGDFVMSFPKIRDVYDPLYTWVYADGFGLRVVAMQRVSKQNETNGEGNISDLTIPLPPLASKPTRVQVLDPNGAPVVGALVCPANIQLPNGPFKADEPTGMVSSIPSEILESLAVRTDRDGSAMFDRFPDGLWYGFHCQNDQYGLQAFIQAQSSDITKLQLSPVGSIRGRIVADDLARFKQFGYNLATSSNISNASEVFGLAIGAIDERGEFHIPVIAVGNISEFHVASASAAQDVELVCDNYLSQKVLPNATLELKLEAPETVAVSGVVLTSDTRQPVSAAIITYSRLGSPHYRRCITDEKGEFRINVIPGKTRFQMISIGEAMGRSGRYGHARKFPEQITEETKLEILLPVNKQVKGKLQDAAGQPIPNRMVARHYGGPLMHLDGVAKTDAQGSFEIYLSSWPLSAGGYWGIVDEIENNKPEITVVNQMSNQNDFFVLERPKVPIQPPKQPFSR